MKWFFFFFFFFSEENSRSIGFQPTGAGQSSIFNEPKLSYTKSNIIPPKRGIVTQQIATGLYAHVTIIVSRIGGPQQAVIKLAKSLLPIFQRRKHRVKLTKTVNR
jgi:hypothetical protein